MELKEDVEVDDRNVLSFLTSILNSALIPNRKKVIVFK